MNRRRRLCAPLLCEALEPRTLLSAVSLSFTDLVAQNTSAPVTSVVSADFNEDGVTDLAALTSGGRLYVSLGTRVNGSVTYTADKTANYTLGSDAADLVVGDFNNDSLIDLAYFGSLGGSDNGVVLLLGQTGVSADKGSGVFDPAGHSKEISIYQSVGGIQLVAANIDNAGATDLYLTYTDVGDITRVASIKQGDLASPTVLVLPLSGPGRMFVGDVNNDSSDDIVYVQNGNTITTYRNASGMMIGVNPSLVTTFTIKDIAFGDFTGDGLNDLVVLADDGAVYMAESNYLTPGSYFQPTDHPIGTFDATTTQILVADVTRDGREDILGITTSGTIQVMLGGKNGAFTPGTSDVIVNTDGTTVGPVILADINGDGSLDLVSGLTVGGTTGQFGVQLNAMFLTTSHTLDSKHRTFTYVDDSGDTVTVKLNGPGTATIELNEIVKQIATITLSGTTTKSSLSFTITNKANPKSPKTTTIGAIIFTSGQLGSLSAANVDFDASLLPDHNPGGILGADDTDPSETVNNATRIGSIKIRDLGTGCGISLTGTAARSSTSLSARVIGDDTEVRIAQAISSATFVDMGNCYFRAVTMGRFTIKGDKKLGIAGDFKGVFILEGVDGSRSNTLGSATIAGALIGGEGVASPVGLEAFLGKFDASFSVRGNVGSISAASATDIFGLHIRGNLARFTTKGDLNGDLVLYSAGAIKAGGKADDLRIHIENSIDAAKSTLGSLTIAGSVTTFRLDSYGNVGSITTGSIGTGTQMNVNGKLTTFRAKGDMNGDLTARSFGTVTVDGNSTDAKLILGSGGVDAGLGATNTSKLASSIYFKGDVVGLALTSNGNFGTFKAKSIDSTSNFAAEGTIDQIRTVGNCSGVFDVDHLKSWYVGGNMTGVVATLGVTDMDAGAKMLDTLTVIGAMNDSTIQGYGDIGTLSAKTLSNSNIYAGYLASETPLDSLDDFSGARTIGAVTITGDSKAVGASTSAAHVYATTIKKASIAFQDADHQSVLIAHTVGSLTVKTLNGKRIVSTVSPSITGPAADPVLTDNVTLNLL